MRKNKKKYESRSNNGLGKKKGSTIDAEQYRAIAKQCRNLIVNWE